MAEGGQGEFTKKLSYASVFEEKKLFDLE